MQSLPIASFTFLQSSRFFAKRAINDFSGVSPNPCRAHAPERKLSIALR
ncbi:hypothetical protein ACPOL_6352 [Acidisarcina polymorpha]|uniref:Uncharacterized protein n=1 Tax=Acidisarcina polymorpha TaxID=2211140 RepID=A0A2Z5GAG4_9BACT|nr:hypothetical protein ACPOL_6352 [Acidisarcina polymorpha]